MKKISIILIILFAHLAFTGLAATYIGTDNNWFNPNNWDTGMVPDGTTDIVLNGNSQVLIDPAISPAGPIMVHNIVMNNNAVLTLMDGTVFQYNQLDVNDKALLDAHSSQLSGDQLQLNTNTGAAGSFGIFFNPTTNDTRLIKIIARTPKVKMFLGGLIAASPGNTGMGHYATLLADDVELNGQLHIETIYGFTPSVGDTFQIVTARNSLIGTFDNAREGDVVARFGQVNLVISYTGGDGNDVVLSAVSDTSTFIGSDGDWFNPNNWDTGTVPGRSDAVVIPTGTPPIFVANATVDVGSVDIDDTDFNLSNGVVHVFGWGYVKSFRKFNPSYVQAQEMTMVGDEGTTAFGLGGTAPASNNNQGPGFYANVQTNNIQLAGSLQILFMYGFVPQDGDVFQIITVDGQLSGSFFGVNEGDIVATLGDVDLYLSYVGGDGNDVVLTAVNNDIIFKNNFEN